MALTVEPLVRVGDAATGLAFTDITLGAGVGDPTPGGHGAAFADADGDGLPDLPDLYITMNAGPLLADRFFRNVGSGFVESGAARGIADVDFGSHGAAFADLDDDGDYDLLNGTTYRSVFVERAPNHIYRNVDVFGVSGWLGSGDPASERNEVYRNDGGFRFTELVGGALHSAPAGSPS